MLFTASATILLLQANPIEPMSVTPETLRDRAPRTGSVIEGAPVRTEPSRLGRCLQTAPLNATATESAARAWVAEVSGADLATANHCLGMALSEQSRWAEAAGVFAAGRSALQDGASGRLDAGDGAYAARLGVLTGSAMLAGGNAQGALDAFARARGDALVAGDATLAANIAVDLASAQGVLGDLASAAGTLAQAREGDPANSAAWLVSAQVARQQGDLSTAQEFIVRAGDLAKTADGAEPDPRAAPIGLEAGIIAALSGRYDAALLSWQSVIALAPDGADAARATELIAQVEELQAPAP